MPATNKHKMILMLIKIIRKQENGKQLKRELWKKKTKQRI
jgi:hypothetical protein